MISFRLLINFEFKDFKEIEELFLVIPQFL